MNRWLAVVGGVSMNLALGSLYAWSVFVLPLEKEFGWTRAQTSWTFTIAIVAFASSFVIAGRIQDLKGPRICAITGAVLVSAGFGLASLTSSLAFLYLCFGLIVGIGNGFGYATPIPVGSKWFPDKRGLVVGLMVGGYGAGSAIFGPVANGLIEQVGWRATFQILAALFFVMGVIGVALLKNPPPGYRPAGWNPPATQVAARSARDISTSEMLRTPTFYALWIAYCLGATAGLMTISQLVPFARNAELGAAAATFAITVGAVGNAGGRILSGWLSDTLGRLTTLRTMIVISAAAMPALYMWREQVLSFYLLVAVVYWCYGTQLSVFASTTADFYGTRYLGLNYGVLFTAWGVAGILGPIIAARVFDAFHDYRYAFFSASALAIIAFASLAFARLPQREREPGLVSSHIGFNQTKMEK
jgi:OFA family oxalate/formate antiporter-like MFS transporter